MELTTNKHPYFTSADSPLSVNTRTVLAYSLNVLTPVMPYFLYELSNDQNHTIVVSNDTNATSSGILVVASGNTLIVDSDHTIELR